MSIYEGGSVNTSQMNILVNRKGAGIAQSVQRLGCLYWIEARFGSGW
jgi:hypothetical protein